MPGDFACYLVEKDEAGARGRVTWRPREELPDGDVLIRVAYSSLNYKDALAATGHPGVVRKFPHVPGVDAVGVVEESTAAQFHAGDEVLVTSFDLGAARWGGWSQSIRVPAEWVLPRPEGLSAEALMILGTAGLTAGLSVEALQAHEITPDRGEVVVTGATGGVGCLAVKLLARLGYQVVAVSGKADRHDWLKQLGAAEVIDREAVDDRSNKPLLSARWAGAVDTVGGNTLATLLRAAQPHACITCCGLVGGTDLPVTVYPFILRGVTLAGIDSAWCPLEQRRRVWQHFAGDWKLDGLAELAETVKFDGLDDAVARILKAQIAGRVVVQPPS